MPTYTLPDTQTGGSQQVQGSSLADAQANAQAAGTWSPAAGTYGSNSLPGAGPAQNGIIPNTSSGGVTGANLAAGSQLLDKAQAAALQAYYNAKLALDTDQNAWQKAAQEAATVIAQAGVTGTYNGMPTQQAIKQAADIAQQQAQMMVSYAQQFGTWGVPQLGQQTLAAQQQLFNQTQNAAQLTGWYTPYTTYVPPQPAAGAGTTATSPSQTTGTGYFVGSDGRIHTGSPTGTGQQGWGSPQGTQAAAGWAPGTQSSDPNVFLQPPAAPVAATPTPATPGAAPQPAATGTTLGAPPGYQAGQPIQTLAAQQQQQQTAQNYLSLLSQLRGPADWAQYQKVLGATPGGMRDLVAAAAGQYIPGAGATTGTSPNAVTLGGFVNQATGQPGTATQPSDQAAMNSLVAPNQMAPQTWNALTDSQKQLLLGQWESQGYTQADAKNLFNQSLPKYATSGPQAGSYRLQ